MTQASPGCCVLGCGGRLRDGGGGGSPLTRPPPPPPQGGDSQRGSFGTRRISRSLHCWLELGATLRWEPALGPACPPRGWGLEAESLRVVPALRHRSPLRPPGAGIQHPAAEGLPQRCDALGDAPPGRLHHSVAGAGPEGQDGKGVQVSAGAPGPASWKGGSSGVHVFRSAAT